MAINSNNFSFKSFDDLEKLARTYKTRVSNVLISENKPNYEIAEISKQELDNITTFLVNSTIKDSKAISGEENQFSLEFSEYLLKYFGNGLTTKDIINLKKFVNSYNTFVANNFYENLYTHIFGINSEIRPEGMYLRIVKEIQNHIRNIVSGFLSKSTQNKTMKKTAAQWYSLVDNNSVVDWSFDDDSVNTYDSKELTVEQFLTSFILKGNTVETLVLLQIISYFNNEIIEPEYDDESEEFELKDDSELESLEEESFFIQPQAGTEKEFTFGTEATLIEEKSFTIQIGLDIENRPLFNKKTLYSLDIKGTNKDGQQVSILKVPMVLKEIEGLATQLNDKDAEKIVEVYNMLVLDDANEDNKINVGDTISLNTLYISMYNNIINFLKNIGYTTLPVTNRIVYENSLNYFVLDGVGINLFNNIYGDIKKVSEVFYIKDFIQESISVSQTEEKIKASNIEITYSQSGEQITFIDVRGIEFQGNELTEARNLFSQNISPAIFEGGELVSAQKLTYTVLYKELNPLLRDVMLFDPQDFVMARVLIQSLKEDIFEANRLGVSFNLDINDIYRNYIERDELFLLDVSFYRFKYFYGNIFAAREASESDIIGFYIGDATENSAFINNYGQFEFEKNEITNFLDIYKVTRDYYYKVLLNKSFIAEDEYKLYEKLFISFFAIERFLNSKIDNIRNIDFFNSRDIFNFLESYGLGVLNSFNFFLNSKDYKLNIIKYFNDLVRLKGSKDVISILLNIFDIKDIDIDIKKFFLLETTQKKDEVDILNYENNENKTITVDFKIERIFQTSQNKFKISKLSGGVYSDSGITPQIFGLNKTFKKVIDDSGLLSPITTYENISININESTSIDPREYVINYFSKSPKLILVNDSNLGLYLTFTEGGIDSERIFTVDNSTKLYDAIVGLGIINSSDVIIMYSDNQFASSLNSSTQTVVTYMSTLTEKSLYVLFTGKVLELSLKINSGYSESDLKFVEVPYFSDNGSKEIISAINSNLGEDYEDFIEDDLYWNKNTVPKQLIKDTDINVAETKYLSLTLTENVYKNYFLSRYMLSAIDYLYDKLVVSQFGAKSNILNNLLLDSGDSLFGNVPVSEYFDVIRILFKAVLKLYDKEIGFTTSEPVSGKYYGINKNVSESDWEDIEDALKEKLPSFSTGNFNEFFTTQKRVGTTETTYKKFSILKSDTTSQKWVRYDPEITIENLKPAVPESLGTVADYLRHSAFSNFKAFQNRFKSQQNSGEYFNNMLENLNFFRLVSGSNVSGGSPINNGRDLWLYILSREDLTSRNQESLTKTILKENLYYTVLENMIRFPIDIAEGLLSPYYLADINHNDIFNNLSESIFEKVYTTSEDPLSVEYNLTTNLAPSKIRDFVEESLEVIYEVEGAIPEVGTDAFTNKLQDLSEKLIATIDGLRTQFSTEPFMQFAFSLKANEAETLRFVETATEIFLSYTTTLYRTDFRKIFRTVSETIPMADKAEHILKARRVEQMSFDEKLTIEKL
jgi:hypothetical protein